MRENIAVIFDFNGTCIFDGKYHNKAWQMYIEELSLKPVSDRDVSLWIMGKTPKEILEHFLGYELTDSMVAQFSEEKERIYRKLLMEYDVSLAPGLKDFLNYLLLAQIKRTIASTADAWNMKMYFEKYNLDMWFKWEDVVINDGKIPLKPHPYIYLAAIEKLGVSADKIVAFEDSESGVEAAYAAGIRHIIAVTGDSWNTKLITKPGVYAQIKNYTELNPDNF
ncbi:MAG: HAD family hydrolase [Eubacterium sp.]|nr:HAD family hydrolase [Eubacterium sp.]